ncbi:TIGR01777 family oxidoreductase [Brooklawnia cerclae]|uniref:TIGR01777 family protein n=1 Tax=Brooklawnia cerclae TaxID=349934 RepID=A0ABX0SMP9_9ACTN|nr:TIGR01777 family oxidoreductase [Brooklawnia cerclae]NIH58598.1 hypothetical protein [Brooklawnia cerclae]
MTTIAISGASGLVGTALAEHLRARGDTVIRLMRRCAVQPDEVGWDPGRAELNVSSLEGVDAIVNLSGAPIGRRWTAAYRREIVESRLGPTRTLARAAAELGSQVTLVNASAVGVYGDRGREPLTEDSEPGEGFVPELVLDWEAATRDASDAGNRVALARTGLVITGRGGALGQLMPLVRLGLAGPIGPGTQVWPWISLADEVGALTWLVDNPVAGPVNLSSPATTTNAQLIAAIARAVNRPARLRVPTWALRLVLGGFADEMVASQNEIPGVLVASGYTFSHPTVEALTSWLATEEA